LLSDGYVDEKGHIVCPVHCYKFQIKSGRGDGPEGYQLKSFPVECRPDGVFVGILEKKRFGWP